MYCADLFPSVHHVSLPYIMAYDMQPLITLREKEEILRMVFRENIALFFEHDALHEVAIIQNPAPGKYQIKETVSLETWLNQN